MPLSGKTALVTGASRGIGLEIAKRFASAGARVVMCSRKDDAIKAAAESIGKAGTVFPRVCHIGDREAVAELLTWCEAEVGTVDVLVNNAATNPHFGPLIGIDPMAFDKTFEINVGGTFAVTQAVANRLVELQQGGSITTVSSVLGLHASPLMGAYGMTKAALVSMTRTLAAELGQHQIRVNAIAPGLVETRFAQALIDNPKFAAAFTERAALGRHAQPAEVAGAAVFLASDDASYVTGHVLNVDGGYSAR